MLKTIKKYARNLFYNFNNPYRDIPPDWYKKYLEDTAAIAALNLKTMEERELTIEEGKKITDEVFETHLGTKQPKIFAISGDVGIMQLMFHFMIRDKHAESININEKIHDLTKVKVSRQVYYHPGEQIFSRGNIPFMNSYRLDGESLTFYPYAIVKIPCPAFGEILVLYSISANQAQHVVAINTDKEISEFGPILEDFIKSIIHQFHPYLGRVVQWEGGTSHIISYPSVANWSDIVPKNELLKEFERCLDLIKNKDKYVEAGIAARRGVILSGPPGSGKTVHIKGFITEAIKLRVPIFLLDGLANDSIISHIYQMATIFPSAIVVLEDIDTIAMNRNGFMATNNSYGQSTLNALLHHLDGINQKDCITIATTNIPDAVDSALAARPGRFDRHFKFGYPSREEREEILALYTKKLGIPLDIPTFFESHPELEWFLTKDGITASFIYEAIASLKRCLIWNKDTDVEDEMVDTINQITHLVDVKKEFTKNKIETTLNDPSFFFAPTP